MWHINVVLTFKSIIITSHHSHLKTLSLSDFMYSYTVKFLRVKKQLSCLLTFLEDYCITVWQINAVFTFKSIIITSSHSHKKHSVYQFSFTATWWKSETIIKENWQLSCLLTISEDFCITMWQIVYVFKQKSKHLQMCHHSQKRLSLPVFTQSYYTFKIFKKLAT